VTKFTSNTCKVFPKLNFKLWIVDKKIFHRVISIIFLMIFDLK
jgi:4-diphosphocytidyl-2C-methyl-D-erythritol kinase